MCALMNSNTAARAHVESASVPFLPVDAASTDSERPPWCPRGAMRLRSSAPTGRYRGAAFYGLSSGRSAGDDFKIGYASPANAGPVLANRAPRTGSMPLALAAALPKSDPHVAAMAIGPSAVALRGPDVHIRDVTRNGQSLPPTAA